MFRIMIAAIVTAAATTAPAFAQDASARAPFTGAHVDVIGGWDRLQGGGHDDGVLYGAGAGYDLQRGRAVFGIEGEASDSTQKEAFDGVTEHAARDLYVGDASAR